MDTGELAVRWTVRVALALYALAVAGLLLGERGRGWRPAARWAWTLGCAAYLAHVGCAFHFFHGWSHAAAYAETARRTQELFGLDWGGGLYFNYLFTAVWAGDVLWWWAAPGAYEARPRWLGAAVHGFMAFMAFNGAVVFATGLIRWVALAIGLALAVLWALLEIQKGAQAWKKV
jgi:hypothetical protein